MLTCSAAQFSNVELDIFSIFSLISETNLTREHRTSPHEKSEQESSFNTHIITLDKHMALNECTLISKLFRATVKDR